MLVAVKVATELFCDVLLVAHHCKLNVPVQVLVDKMHLQHNRASLMASMVEVQRLASEVNAGCSI